jgi:UDPglucose 6-dehydrogenase
LNITVVGQGYVGLVTAACLADWGHQVTGVDSDPGRISSLAGKQVPFHEPGLADLVARGVDVGRLAFERSSATLIESSDVVFLAVGTHDGNGGWQTSTVLACLQEIVPDVRDDAVVVIRSTLPPEFVGQLDEVVSEIRRQAGRGPIAVLMNPEFTREGAAIHDFMHPDRVVLGVSRDPDEIGVELLRVVYARAEAPVLVMPAMDAALAKLGSNLFLATKISFANEYASLCDRFGASIDNVVTAMSYDTRIGGQFLRAGVGFGGSCLPHQVTMTVRTAASVGVSVPLMAAVDEINHRRRSELVERLESLVDRPLDRSRIALLGLTFKPHTDDLRDAPSLTIARLLIDQGATVVAWDPMASARDRASEMIPQLRTVAHPEAALNGADAAAIVTEWPELRSIDWAAALETMRGNGIFDGRNVLDPNAMSAAGYRYDGFGRGLHEANPAVSRPAGTQTIVHDEWPVTAEAEGSDPASVPAAL